MTASPATPPDAISEALDLFCDRLDSALALGEVVFEELARRNDPQSARLQRLIQRDRQRLRDSENIRAERATAIALT